MVQQPVVEHVRYMREREHGYAHAPTKHLCRFCEKGKIVSGIFLEFNGVGHPCCEQCWSKDGFNEWYAECEQQWKKIPKQLDWFVEMFMRGLTPEEAVDDMLLSV